MSQDAVAEDPRNRPGRIEANGTDYIALSERRGNPRRLFAVWASSNITYLYFVLGGLLILFGLNIWQAILVIVAGNLVWIAVGYIAISGPSSGSPSEVITRSFFGVNGNRIFQVLFGWMIGVLYEAISLSIGALAGFALVQMLFPATPDIFKAVAVIILAIATFTISLYGHATIMKLSPWFTWALLAAIIVLAGFVLAHANFGYTPKGGVLTGLPLWAVAASGFAIIAAAPLSWQVSADYSRYLPESTSSKAVAFWTALGAFIPSAGIAILGVLAGTVIDMSVPQLSMAQILPTWFYAVFLLIIVVGSVTSNSLTAYSAGLALIASGIPWRRSVTIIFDAVVAVSATLYALLVSNFLDTLSSLLTVSVAVLTPAMAIYVVDVALRRNRYDGPSLQDTSRSSRYWFSGGFNVGGLVALVVGTFAAALFVNTPFFVGPFATLLGGADLSIFAGAIAGGGLYGLTQQRRVRAAASAFGRVPTRAKFDEPEAVL